MNSIYFLILRLIHIPAGVVWVGGTLMMVFGVLPAAQTTAPESGKFMAAFGPRSGKIAMVSSGLALLSGVLLYERVTGTFQASMMGTPYGLSLLIGGISAITAFIYGMASLARNNARMEAITEEVAKAGGPPSAEQAAELKEIAEKNGAAIRIVVILQVLTVLCMAAAEAL